MATTTAADVRVADREHAADAVSAMNVPWYIWCAVLAVTSVMIGGHWDISWHSTIGRDTFWTPAHMAIYLCGILSGIAFGYVILHTTFSTDSPLANASVHIWGFRAPLGAFIASWGGIVMLTSAPFDNWWHAAYGLDVKIVSPPHVLLFIGIYGVLLGTLVLIAGHMNRIAASKRGFYRWLFLYVCGMNLVLTMVILMEYTSRVFLHTALPYILICAFTPIMVGVASRVTGFQYSATAVAGWYTLFLLALILILPLFPAEPKLGPVYQNVTRFVPPQFPILLIVPAFAMDLLWARLKHWNVWASAALSAAGYVFTLFAVEWPFASFLMTPSARNAFFGAGYLYYGLPPGSYLARGLFYSPEHGFVLAKGLAIALVWCTIAMRWGFSRGEWLRSLQR